MRRFGLIATALLGLALLAQAGSARAEQTLPSVSEAAHRVMAANKALEAHSNDFWLDDTAEAPGLLAAYWDTIHAWTTAWLQVRSDLKPQDLTKAATAFDDWSNWQFMQLGAGEVLISASRGEQGDVFILRQVRGRWILAWSLTAWAASHNPDGPLAGWKPEGARNDCREHHSDGDWSSCGPLFGTVGQLPPDGRGRPRFYISANYAQEAGADIGGQASIWVWTGDGAEPQYVHAYGLTIEQDEGIRIKGDRLLIREKDSFKTLFACAACLGRQMDRTVRLTPDGAVDLGRVSLVPDLDLADEAMDRVLSGQPTGPMVAPRAASMLKAALADPRAKRQADPKDSRGLGMIDGWTLRPSRGGRRLCLVTDEAGALEFTLRGPARHARIVAVRTLPGDCGKKVRS